MADETYDLIVLGSGSGAKVANHAADAGMSVAVIEARDFGGTCALRGCNPKKVLTRSAELMRWVDAMDDRYLRKNDAELSWQLSRDYQQTYVEGVPDSSQSSLEDHGVTTITGRPRFTGPRTLEVDGRTLSADRVVIATGSQPTPVDFPGADLLTTSDEFLFLDQLPESIVFLGGGYISAEFASIANAYGREATIVERSDRILTEFDADLVEALSGELWDNGVRLCLGKDVARVEQDGGRFRTTLRDEETGEEQTLESDMVVHGLGRSANLSGLDLEAAGVEAGDKGVRVDDFAKTTADNVWAIGDCADTGKPMLTPVANDAARAVTDQILGRGEGRLDDGPIPYAAYTLPQIAAVGMTEDEARQKHGEDLTVRCEDMSDWTTYRKVGAKVARYKTLIAGGKVVGAHVLGPHAAETINTLAMVVRFGVTTEEVKRMLFAYPTLSSEIKAMV